MDVKELENDRSKLMYAWYLCQFDIYRQTIGWEMVEHIYRRITGPARYGMN